MAIEPIKIFQNNADNSIAALFNGGQNVLTGILNNAIQIGRDISNKQLQQEQDLLGLRRQEAALQQRRAENLQQDWEDVFRFSENRRQFDTKFSRGLFESDRAYEANRDDTAWQQGFSEDSLAQRERLANRNYELQAAQEERLAKGSEIAAKESEMRMSEIERQRKAAEERERRYGALLSPQGGAPAGVSMTTAQTGSYAALETGANDLLSGVRGALQGVRPTAPAMTPQTPQGGIAALKVDLDSLGSRIKDYNDQADKASPNEAAVLRSQAREMENRRRELAIQIADEEARLVPKKEDRESYTTQRSKLESVVKSSKWKHFVPNSQLAVLNEKETAVKNASEKDKETAIKEYNDLLTNIKSGLFDRVYGDALASTTFEDFIKTVESKGDNPEATAVLRQIWDFAHPSKNTASTAPDGTVDIEDLARRYQ